MKKTTEQMALEALKDMVELAQMTLGMGGPFGSIFGVAKITEGADGPLPNAIKAITALEADIAQAVEPVEVQMRVGKRGSWRKPDGDMARAYQLMRDNPGVYELRELFTVPPAAHDVNAELLEALENLMAWQVKNIKAWSNTAYDQAAKVVAKAGGAT